MPKDEKLKIKGRVRGTAFKEDFSYVKEVEGEAGLAKLKQSLKKSPYPEILNTNIGTFEWYPLEWHVYILLKCKEIFGWTDKDIVDFGYKVTKYTIFLKLYLKYFFSVEKAIKKSHEYCREIYDQGDVVVEKADFKNKIIIIKIKNFKIHPILCNVVLGYLQSLGEMVFGKGKDAQAKEIKCEFRGDHYHEYQVNWK